MFNALFLYWHYPALNIKVSSLNAKCKYDKAERDGVERSWGCGSLTPPANG